VLVKNGAVAETLEVSVDPFTVSREVVPPADGSEERWRAEVHVGGDPRTVSGHVWLVKADAPPKGCGCESAGPGVFALLALALAGVRRRHGA
jgi:MYXO-CTERM domain-containing protein